MNAQFKHHMRALGLGIGVAAAAFAALFGHRLGLPSLQGNLPGDGLAALIPLLVPIVAASALLLCARSRA